MSEKEESLSDTLRRYWSKFMSSNPDAKARDMGAQRANAAPPTMKPGARDVPVGTGIADKGKKAVSGRQRQIDAAVDAMD